MEVYLRAVFEGFERLRTLKQEFGSEPRRVKPRCGRVTGPG
jgi:hypothetical protein